MKSKRNRFAGLIALVFTLSTLLSNPSLVYAQSNYDPHSLSDFGYRTVNTHGQGALVFQTEPGGSFLSDHQFWTGDRIYVNLSFRERGYALAYDGGVYGFVDASYIDWGTGSTTSSAHDLSGYGYRTVKTGGRGNLVFQTEPGGSFLSDHSFANGDSIYVNLTYREKGYAIAYDRGTYGYVDASYIDWGTGSSSTSSAHDLSGYGYRTVKTGGRGNLVFQTEPGGSFLSDHSFANGDSIYVHLTYREKGYAIAYDRGTYGYVDASYIDWGTSTSTTYDPHSFSHFGYRTVNTHGQGALVFQTAPGGSFLSDHQFWTGDSIYVNLDWREQGYAIAYEDGVYGYVDASYINW